LREEAVTPADENIADLIAVAPPGILNPNFVTDRQKIAAENEADQASEFAG